MLWSVFFFSGLVAYAAYKDCDPLTSGRIKKPDQIMPFLVMDKLERLPGLPGLFVAGVYGGVLRSGGQVKSKRGQVIRFDGQVR